MKGNLSNFDSRKTYHPHDIFYSNHSCDSHGNINNGRYLYPRYKYASLDHYYTKSIREYCLKVKRGRAFLNVTVLEKSLVYFYFYTFFSINKKTKEKIAIFNNAFNTSFK